MTQRVFAGFTVYKCAFVCHLWANIEHIYQLKLDITFEETFPVRHNDSVSKNLREWGPTGKVILDLVTRRISKSINNMQINSNNMWSNSCVL